MTYNIMIQGWQWQSEWLVGLGKLASTANLSIIHRPHHSLQIVQISWMGCICLYICFLMLAKIVEIQLKRIPCRLTHVQIMHVGLLGRQNSQLMQNPLFYFGIFFFSTKFLHLLPHFSADNLFVGTDATS